MVKVLCIFYHNVFKMSSATSTLNWLEMPEALTVAGHFSLELGLGVRKWTEDEEGAGAWFPQESSRDRDGNQSWLSLCGPGRPRAPVLPEPLAGQYFRSLS